MNTLILVTSFVLGLSSSLHCLGMCGPLVAAVPFSNQANANMLKGLYFLGKALAYGMLGAVIGLLGLKAIWGEMQQYISIFAGIIVVIMILFPLLKPNNAKFPFQKYFSILYNKLQYKAKWYHFIALGFFNGLLPCGMVYVALAAALATGNPFEGFLAMLLFGLGTSPVLWLVTLLKGKLSFQLRQKLKPISLAVSLIVGCLLIVRGLNLGIPYISPKMNTVEAKAPACCSTNDESH